MSADSRDNMSVQSRWKGLACALAALMAVGFTSTATVLAQDATPEASPVAAECVAPELPPGAPTAMDEMASPEAMDMAGMEMATPVADEGEGVAPAEEPIGTAAEGEVAAEIESATRNILACLDSGQTEGVAALMTTDFMMSEFGTGNPYDVAMFLEGFSFGEVTIENPMTYEDGRVSVDISYMGSQYQLAGETWFLVQDGEYWKLDESSPYTPPYEGDSAIVGVNLTEETAEDGSVTYAITPNTPSVAQIEVLVLHGINAGSELHEIVVLQLPEGADPMGILDGTISEADVTFIGQITLEPGEEGDMVLMGLPAGMYTLVCFFPGPDGAPHVANGMIAPFEVTAPAE